MLVILVEHVKVFLFSLKISRTRNDDQVSEYCEISCVVPICILQYFIAEHTVNMSLVYCRTVQELNFFNALTHCVNFFNALINALLTHPGPTKRRVGGKLPRAPQRLGAPPDVIASIEIY